MKLTTKSEYSILALIHIARCGKKDFVSIDSICAKYGMPRKYLEHLLAVLKQNRYLKARRGTGGGYKLAVRPSGMSVAQIIRLMDGALAPVESVSTYFFSHTPIEQEKKVIVVLKDIRNYIAKRLENLKLSDLV
ncbi:MAG: Rrf2 family transcriptional regulator [Candidatus Omnitrophica bacterium]|nr:Rrf2 family transcriptional regulator [Candidatus Omnitrophota bacterium]